MSTGVALVTGAARRIGASIAMALANEGFAVIIHANCSRDAAEALAEEIVNSGGRAAVVFGDLSDTGRLGELFTEACAPFGPPDLLVNNASRFVSDSFGMLNPDELAATLAVNLSAPLLLAEAFAKALPAPRRGAIVNIIDQRVLKPNPQHFSYALSKSGLYWATKTMAQALAPRIRVNAVGPGPTLPNLRDGDAGFAQEAGGTLLGVPVSPAAIAEAVLYLARADAVTGQMIAVDSGQHLSWLTPDIIEG